MRAKPKGRTNKSGRDYSKRNAKKGVAAKRIIYLKTRRKRSGNRRVDGAAYVDRVDNPGAGKPPARFKKGNPGRPPGTKNVIPRNVKASVRQILEDVAREKVRDVRTAIEVGIRSGPRHSDRYLRLMAEYVDGKPDTTINLNNNFKAETVEESARMLQKQMTKLVTKALAQFNATTGPDPDASAPAGDDPTVGTSGNDE